MQLDRRPKRNNQLFGPNMTNNFFPRILIIRGMTFEFEYLGDFEFIFENNLGSWSGDQELAFDEKKRMSKISCKCTELFFLWPSGPLSGCLGCCPLGWQPDSPLALNLRLLAYAELCCSTRPASPAWSSQEPSDLSGLDPSDPLGLMQDVPWALSVNL